MYKQKFSIKYWCRDLFCKHRRWNKIFKKLHSFISLFLNYLELYKNLTLTAYLLYLQSKYNCLPMDYETVWVQLHLTMIRKHLFNLYKSTGIYKIAGKTHLSDQTLSADCIIYIWSISFWFGQILFCFEVRKMTISPIFLFLICLYFEMGP